MSDKVQKIKEDLAEAEWSEAMDERAFERAVAEAQLLGSVKATLAIGRALAAGGFQRLRKFIDDEGYKALRCKTAVEFLNSDHSPMSKNQYYDRLNAFKREDEEVFDLLNSMDISLRNRKLLAKGEIRIDGEEVVVGHDDHEERLPMSDRLGVKTLIATLAEAKARGEEKLAEQDRKIKRGEKDVEKYKRRLSDAERRGGGPTAGTPHGQALLTLVGAYKNLCDEVVAYREACDPAAAGDEEFQAFRKSVVETIGSCYVELSDAFDLSVPKADDDLGLSDSEAAEMLEN